MILNKEDKINKILYTFLFLRREASSMPTVLFATQPLQQEDQLDKKIYRCFRVLTIFVS